MKIYKLGIPLGWLPSLPSGLRLILLFLFTQLCACATVDQERLIHLLPQLETQHLRENPNNADLQVTFFGVSTLLFEAGQTALLIDGFFSRPNRVLFKNVAPDRRSIVRVLEEAGVYTCEKNTAKTETVKLDAVVVVHSHYDHAMDVAEVAALTGATVYGSKSTRNIVRDFDTHDAGTSCRALSHPSEIKALSVIEPEELGDLKLVAYTAKHIWTPASPLFAGKISTSFSAPASISEYKEGKVYGLKIETDGNTILVHASARCPANADHPGKADVVFLGIGGLVFKGEEYFEGVLAMHGRKTEAKRVYAIHWDNFKEPIANAGLSASRLAKVPDILRFFSALDGDKKRLRLPPTGKPFALHDN